MILESNNKICIKNEFKNIEKKIVLFIVSLCINLVMFNESPILFITPFLILGYMMGFSYLIIAILGCFIGSVVYSPLSFFATCLFIVLFLICSILLKLLNIKVSIRMLLSSYISDLLGRYIFSIGIKDEVSFYPLFFSLISLVLSILILEISISLINEEKRQYSYKIVFYILSIISLSLLGLDFNILNVSILFIVLSLFFLFTNRILDFNIYFSLLFINLLIILLLKDFNNYMLLSLFLPSILIGLSNNKYLKLLIFNVSSISLILFYKESINNYIIELIIISLLYIFIPSFFIDKLKEIIMNPLNSLELYEKKYKRKNKEVEIELSKFSNLFNLIVEEYDKDNDKRLERKKEDVIYRSLCLNCHKNKVCYSKDGVLKDLMLKSIEGELNDDEVSFVNKECLKPSKFFDLSALFKKDFYKEYKYSLEYKGLKEALKSQLNGLSNVLTSYKDTLLLDHSLNINYENELVKRELDKHQFDVMYVNVNKDLKDNYFVNLCVKIMNHQLIYKIRDLISNVLNINLEIKLVSNFSVEGFLKIELNEVKEYKFTYGVYQINLSEEGNGDSYLIYENNNYMIYCLSDGMGVGKLAQEESRFTLRLLKSILETGMDLRNAIMLINSLLKVKNRFDMYATLDLVSINKRNLKSHFFKNGAMHSYIYSNVEDKFIEVNTSSLPIGIIDHISSYDFSFKLRKNDFIIMFSDGIKEDIQSFETFFKNIKGYNPQIIAHELASKFKNVNEVDDVSVLVIKIEK